MSEELEIVVNAPTETPVVESTPTPTETPVEQSPVSSYEATAREQGWVPKEEWDGDPEQWRPAKEFVERGELFEKMSSMGKDLKETKKALRMLQEHHTKVKETEYKRAVEELKALQKKHMEEGNSEGYLEATDLLTDLKAEQKAREVVEQNTPAQPDPRFLSWVDKNQWYARDSRMRDYADTLGLAYAQRNPGVDPEDVLKFVTQEVKERFKDRFTNPNRTKPSAVEGSTGTPPVKKNKLVLSEEETSVMNTFVRNGIMSKEEYMKELALSKGVAL